MRSGETAHVAVGIVVGGHVDEVPSGLWRDDGGRGWGYPSRRTLSVQRTGWCRSAEVDKSLGIEGRWDRDYIGVLTAGVGSKGTKG